MQLSGFNCLAAIIFLTFRSTPISSSNVASYTNVLSSADILSQDGTSLTGYTIRDVLDVTTYSNDNSIMSMEYFENFYAINSGGSGVFIISWSRSPVQDLITGSSHGFCALTGFEIFKFTTNGTLTPGTFQLDAWCRNFSTARIRNGVLTSDI